MVSQISRFAEFREFLAKADRVRAIISEGAEGKGVFWVRILCILLMAENTTQGIQNDFL